MQKVKNKIINPYKDIEWEKVKQAKAQLNCHTTIWNDWLPLNSNNRIALLENNNYSITSATEGSVKNWDIKNEESLHKASNDFTNMYIIKSDYVTMTPEHINCYFGEYSKKTFGIGQDEYMITDYSKTTENVGRIVYNYPNPDRLFDGVDTYTEDFFVKLFKDNLELLGFEIYRLKDGSEFYSRILDKLMPYRPVWMFSCDDVNTVSDLRAGSRYMTFLMRKDGIDEIQKCMDRGLSFAHVYHKIVTNNGDKLHLIDNNESKRYVINEQVFKMPKVISIVVDEESNTVTINADKNNTTEIVWYGKNNNIIGRGSTLEYLNADGSIKDEIGEYFRANLNYYIGNDHISTTSTQPFGIGDPKKVRYCDKGLLYKLAENKEIIK